MANHSPYNIIRNAEDYSAALPDLMLMAHNISSTLKAGPYKQRRSGQGDNFWQYRGYESGDAPKLIDWKASAKAGDTLVLQKEAEHAQNILIHAPFHDNMTYRIDDSIKSRLTELAGKISDQVKSNQNIITDKYSISLLISASLMLYFQDNRHPFCSSAHPKTLFGLSDNHLMEQMGLLCEASINTSLNIQNAHNSYLFWIDDFWQSPEDIKTQLTAMMDAKIIPILIQVTSKDELMLPFKGHVEYRNMEGTQRHDIPLSQEIRSAYYDQLAEHYSKIAAIIKTHQAYFFSFTSGIFTKLPFKIPSSIIACPDLNDLFHQIFTHIAVERGGS